MSGRFTGARYQEEQRRIAWLLAHQALWIGYGGPWDPRTKAIVAAMMADGLYSRLTRWEQVALWGLIIDARKQRREAAAGESTADLDTLDSYRVA